MVAANGTALQMQGSSAPAAAQRTRRARRRRMPAQPFVAALLGSNPWASRRAPAAAANAACSSSMMAMSVSQQWKACATAAAAHHSPFSSRGVQLGGGGRATTSSLNAASSGNSGSSSSTSSSGAVPRNVATQVAMVEALPFLARTSPSPSPRPNQQQHSSSSVPLPGRSSSPQQLLQTIAMSTDWRFLQDLYRQHHSTLTTAHIAAIAMQLPKASMREAGLDASVLQTAGARGGNVNACILSDGLQALYEELLPRLEGQLHVLPARLLLGVAGALDVCGMPCSASWRAAFLSASAVLVQPTLAGQQGQQQGQQQQRGGSPGRGGECSALEVLALSHQACLLYSQPGCSDEAMGSAALTERLVTMLRAGAQAAQHLSNDAAAGGLAAAAHGGSMSSQRLQQGLKVGDIEEVAEAEAALMRERLGSAAAAAQGLLEGGGALERAEAFPARVVLQVLEAVHGLGVQPSAQWLQACHSGLQVTAKPAQMTAAEALLTRLGWSPSSSASGSNSSTTHSSTASGSNAGLGGTASSHGAGYDNGSTGGGDGAAASAAPSGRQLSSSTKEELASLLSARQASHSSASASHSSGFSAGSSLGGGAAALPSSSQQQQRQQRGLSPTPTARRAHSANGGSGSNISSGRAMSGAGSAAGERGRSVTPSAPNSALEGMLGLLRDAASSGMLPELKSTVFGQLEGCDPTLVLWTAEAFHQLGCALTSRELAMCVHLAASAVDAQDRESGVPAWDVLALVQRCLSQGALIPPGQLEHLYEYVCNHRSQLRPPQLVELLCCSAALAARAASHLTNPNPSATLTLGAAMDEPWGAAWGAVGGGTAGWAQQQQQAAAAAAEGPVSGSVVYGVMEALRTELAALTGEQLAKLAAALSALATCGVVAARPLPQWLSAYCAAAQPLLAAMPAAEQRQALGLLARAQHQPTDAFLAAAARAARKAIPAATKHASSASSSPPSSSATSAGSSATVALAGGADGASARAGNPSGGGGRNAGQLGDVLAVLELLVLELGCPPSAQLAVDVATLLVPALGSMAQALTPVELAGALRLLAAMRCRPPPGAVQKLLGALERYLFQLTPGKVALVAWACAELGAVPRRAFLARYLEAAAEALPEMRPESLALLGRSFAQLGVVPDASWQKAYRDAVLVRLPEADAETLSVLGQGLLHLGLRPDAAWLKGFIIESTFKLPEADAASVARYAHFMASCEVPPPWEWVQALMERTLAVAPEEYDPPDLLPLVLRSLVRLGWAPEPVWLTEVLRRVGMRAGDLDPSSLIITANALATLQATSDEQLAAGGGEEGDEAWAYDEGVTFAALDVLLQAALSKLEDFSARELRWLLDPCLMLNHYHMHPDVAEALDLALAGKEQALQQQQQATRARAAGARGGAAAEEADGGDADRCHESVAMVLNDFVSDSWLSMAVMA